MKGRKLAALLNRLDVEHYWLPGRGINWKDGTVKPARKPISSHCSTFVAAVCYKLNIYILRPPKHSQKLLANAQFNWLEKSGVKYGWKFVSNPWKAQRLANCGFLVVASYINPDPSKPGHIAVIRPFYKSWAEIFIEGPQIVQAGMQNYNSIPLNIGFDFHPEAWSNGLEYQLKFYAHKIK